MIDYIQGSIAELSPTSIVLETNGVGYMLHIALPTYTAFNGKTTAKLYVYEVIREDAYTLYGFLSNSERQLFLLLISVSGIGANTARIILSSYSVQEIQEMIVSENVVALNAIKGIGIKTAQRIIVELKDKIVKGSDASTGIRTTTGQGEKISEAISALVMLGYTATASQKTVNQIFTAQPNLSVEQLLKLALKMM